MDRQTAMTNSIALTEYRPQGIGHIVKLGGIVTAGFYFVSLGGSALFAAPLALATCYQLFKTANKTKDPDWCESLAEIWTYKITPRHRSLEDDYDGWCEKWGTAATNQLIEPMVGQCHYANFRRDKKHPYHGLLNVLVYDTPDDDLPPLTPHDYVAARLRQFEEAIARSSQFVVTVREQQESRAIAVPAVEVMEPADPSSTLDSAPLEKRVSEVPLTPFQRQAEPDVFQFLLSLTQAPLQPVIWAGPPGAGKGVGVLQALRLGKRQNGLSFWVFNPKAALHEAGYWVEADQHILEDALNPASDSKIFLDLMATLRQFAEEGVRRNNTPGNHPPFVLLIEEVTTIVSKFTPAQKQKFKSVVTSLTSMLRGVNMALWLSGQSPNVEELGVGSRSNRAMFTAIACVGPNRAAVAPICDLLAIPFDPSKLQGEGRYYLTSEAVYLTPPPPEIPMFGSWQDVPNLVDMRTEAAPPKPQQPQTPTDKELWASYQQWKGSDRQWLIATLGDEGGSYHAKLQKLKRRFGTSETDSEPVAAA